MSLHSCSARKLRSDDAGSNVCVWIQSQRDATFDSIELA